MPKFNLGRLLMTPGVEALMRTHHEEIRNCLLRHGNGDWGIVSAEDKKTNDRALYNGFRLLSAYMLSEPELTKIWIITEADRSATTILLPSEY